MSGPSLSQLEEARRALEAPLFADLAGDATVAFLDRVLRRTLPPYPALFRRQLPSIITPRDFDLSPYFEIIKFNPVEATNFDYRRITWEDAEARAVGGARTGS